MTKKKVIDGPAIVYCEGAFNTPNGKTAHGLVRFTERYDIRSVIDSAYAGRDSGDVLDKKPNGIGIYASLQEAIKHTGKPAYFVIGLAPDGGRLPADAWGEIMLAARLGIHIDSGLHDYLSNNPELMAIAREQGITIRDVRKTPERDQLHFFSGKITEVKSLKLAVLGTDSAVGKRTTAWKLVHGLRHAGISAEMIGTGQTAWLQGAKYSFVLDSLINDFISGEIEHAIYEAWKNENPDVIVLEGQGSLLNPAYPGGFELLAAGRPDYVVLQHAPRRLVYDGFPDCPMHPLSKQIEAIEVISGKKVITITLNHEDMEFSEIEGECEKIFLETGIPCTDVLIDGPGKLVEIVQQLLKPVS